MRANQLVPRPFQRLEVPASGEARFFRKKVMEAKDILRNVRICGHWLIVFNERRLMANHLSLFLYVPSATKRGVPHLRLSRDLYMRPQYRMLSLTGAGMHSASGILGFDIDHESCLRSSSARGNSCRGIYYSTIANEAFTSIPPLLD
jgi:hypothetical protein